MASDLKEHTSIDVQGLQTLLGGETYSALRWNDGYGADCGPSQGDLFRRGIRPFEMIAIRSATDCPRPEADLQDRPCERAESARKRTLAERVGCARHRACSLTMSQRPSKPESR
jgi:hypothetical protein